MKLWGRFVFGIPESKIYGINKSWQQVLVGYEYCDYCSFAIIFPFWQDVLNSALRNVQRGEHCLITQPCFKLSLNFIPDYLLLLLLTVKNKSRIFKEAFFVYLIIFLQFKTYYYVKQLSVSGFMFGYHRPITLTPTGITVTSNECICTACCDQTKR